MSWLTDVRYGVGALLAAEHPTLFQHSESAYTPAQLASGLVPIVGLVMPEAPVEVLALDVTQVAKGVESIFRAQFRTRALTEARLDHMEDALADTFERKGHTEVGGATLILSTWSSGAALGQDGAGRVLRSANYYLTMARPLAHSA